MKIPKTLPAIGDRVSLRGDCNKTGILDKVGERYWAFVTWDQGVDAPKIVHHFELRQAHE